jgi:hypothetical protein
MSAPTVTPETPAPSESPSRRAFLRKLVRGGLATVAAVAGGALAIRLGGYAVDDRRAAYLKVLSPWHLAVLDAVSARLCLADVPYDAIGAPPRPADVGVAEFVDAFVAAAHPTVQRDVQGLLALVEHLWPLRCGHAHRFTQLDATAQDDVLAKMEGASIGLVRGAFQGLKTLVMMGYWRDPRTWGVLRYDGPEVARPDGGWTPIRFRPVISGAPERAR